MNKYIFFCLILFQKFSYSQSGWNYLPNAPVSTGRFDDIYFINDSTGWAVNGDGQIYRTSDGGDAWVLQTTVPYYIRSVEFINDTLGFAGTLNGAALKTEDAGLTWNNIEQTFPQPVAGICGIGHWGDTIIMQGIWSSPAFILRSLDAGLTWSHIDMSSVARGLVDCWFQTQDTVFVSGIGLSATGSHGVIFRSVDAGTTWSLVGTSSTPSTYAWKLQFTSPLTGYCSLSESTGTQSHVMKTTDGGSTWSTLFVTNTNIDGEGIGFVNDSVGWTGGWSTGMYQTNDGGVSWFFVNFGLNLNRFVFFNQNLGYAAGLSIYKFSGLPTGTVSTAQERKDIHSIEIYPEPVGENADMKINIGKNTMTIFEMYDENGRVLKEFVNGILSKGEYTYNLEALKFPAGVYYAVLRTNEHFLTKQFVVAGK